MVRRGRSPRARPVEKKVQPGVKLDVEKEGLDSALNDSTLVDIEVSEGDLGIKSSLVLHKSWAEKEMLERIGEGEVNPETAIMVARDLESPYLHVALLGDEASGVHDRRLSDAVPEKVIQGEKGGGTVDVGVAFGLRLAEAHEEATEQLKGWQTVTKKGAA
ncbi:hypothetical protein Dimus_016775 [Dionaea muscipula]